MTTLIGIDVGTSATKVLAVDEETRPLAEASIEYPLASPRPGWTEQDPDHWWQAACQGLRQVREQAGFAPDSVAGISFSGQMHGSVFLGKNMRPVRPCILWNDARTHAECNEITEKAGPERLLDWVGNPALAGFTAPKIVWLKNHEPENFKRVHRVMLPKDYVRLRMTGEDATEISDAAGTLLYHVRERRWCGELLDLLEIPRHWMPPVHESSGHAGQLTTQAAEAMGLAPGIPIIAGAADNPCGAIGAGAVRQGRAMLSLGTSGVLYMPSDGYRADEQGRLHAFCSAVPDQWYLMGVVLSAGMSLSWFRDQIADPALADQAKTRGQDPYDLLTEAAARVPLGAEGLYYLPYLTGERTPVMDARARGAFIGLSVRHGRDAMFRALVEGVCYALLHNWEVARAAGVPLEETRLIGGGAKSPFWSQMLADQLGAAIRLPRDGGGPALGAAILAGVGAGVYPDLREACDRLVQLEREIEPNPENHKAYRERFERYRALYPALTEHFAASADIEEN